MAASVETRNSAQYLRQKFLPRVEASKRIEANQVITVATRKFQDRTIDMHVPALIEGSLRKKGLL